MTGNEARGTVHVRVPAKVNVQLSVGGRRADGFHSLANVFFAVGLFDTVTARPGTEGVQLTASGPQADRVPLDGSNLAARAARLLAEHHGLGEPAVALHIDKDIPVAGGMAGGSADAAGALVACDTLWGTRTPREELLALAAELGSDVPFALVGGAALGLGRGERLTPLTAAGTWTWVFAVADGELSTPAVYRECDRLRDEDGPGSDASRVPEPAASERVLGALRTGDAEALAGALVNDLQPAAVSLRPQLTETLRTGTDAGALAALVSGSGPTCAFLTDGPEAAARVAGALVTSGTCRDARTAAGPVPGATVLD